MESALTTCLPLRWTQKTHQNFPRRSNPIPSTKSLFIALGAALNSERVRSVSGARNEQDNSDTRATRNWLDPKTSRTETSRTQGSDFKKEPTGKGPRPHSNICLPPLTLAQIVLGHTPCRHSRGVGASPWLAQEARRLGLDNTSNPSLGHVT